MLLFQILLISISSGVPQNSHHHPIVRRSMYPSHIVIKTIVRNKLLSLLIWELQRILSLILHRYYVSIITRDSGHSTPIYQKLHYEWKFLLKAVESAVAIIH